MRLLQRILLLSNRLSALASLCISFSNTFNFFLSFIALHFFSYSTTQFYLVTMILLIISSFKVMNNFFSIQHYEYLTMNYLKFYDFFKSFAGFLKKLAQKQCDKFSSKIWFVQILLRVARITYFEKSSQHLNCKIHYRSYSYILLTHNNKAILKT